YIWTRTEITMKAMELVQPTIRRTVRNYMIDDPQLT
ncbi:unnamed protein product, partial [Litomosoides sigmodontis]